MDVYVNMEKFEIGRNFATKVWNAARFMKMHMQKLESADWRSLAHSAPDLDPALLRDDDRHMLARCNTVIAAVTGHLENFRLQDGALAIYAFVWTDFCDWYLEYAKQDLYGADADRRRQVLALMTNIFAKALKLLHPYMPFLTEELWHQMGYGADDETIMRASWPQTFSAAEIAAWGVSSDVTAYVDAKRELVTAGRALRADYNIAPALFVKFVVKAVDANAAGRLTADLDTLKQQLRASEIEIDASDAHGGAQAMPGTLCKLGAVCLPLEGLVDAKAEAARVKAELDKAIGFLASR